MEAPRSRRDCWGRVLFWVFTSFVLLIALAVFAHWLWGNRTWNRIVVERAALRAAGEPLTTQDLIQKHVPDERNGVVLLLKAATLIDRDSEASIAYWKLEWPLAGSRFPLTAEELNLLQRMVDELAGVFPLVEEAAQLNEFDWKIDYTAGFGNVDLSSLQKMRELSHLLEAGALTAYTSGNHARALKLVEQIRFLAEAVGTQASLVSSLTSIGLRARHASLLWEMAATLKIDSSDPQAVSPQRVQQLIRELLDEARIVAILQTGMRGERVAQQDMLQALLEGRPIGESIPGTDVASSRLAGIVMGPMFKENGLLMLQHMNRLIGSLDQPDLPSYEQRVPDRPVEIINSPKRYMLAGIALPALSRSAFTQYQLMNDSALAATALACRWYAIENGGELPESLDQLVPQYLPYVPLDRVAGDGKTIGYVNDPDRPRVYHVGLNRIDDGGREPDLDVPPSKQHLTRDTVVHLKLQPRVMPEPLED